ncbi:MAG: hypothetical protein AAFN41_05855 [Planctomycetota bacterium]
MNLATSHIIESYLGQTGEVGVDRLAVIYDNLLAGPARQSFGEHRRARVRYYSQFVDGLVPSIMDDGFSVWSEYSCSGILSTMLVLAWADECAQEVDSVHLLAEPGQEELRTPWGVKPGMALHGVDLGGRSTQDPLSPLQLGILREGWAAFTSELVSDWDVWLDRVRVDCSPLGCLKGVFEDRYPAPSEDELCSFDRKLLESITGEEKAAYEVFMAADEGAGPWGSSWPRRAAAIGDGIFAERLLAWFTQPESPVSCRMVGKQPRFLLPAGTPRSELVVKRPQLEFGGKQTYPV